MKTAAKARTEGDPRAAVAYLRVSTDEQNNGVEAQRRDITRWAKGAGVLVVAWYEDRISGATPVEDRPAMLDALAALREHGAGLLVAAKRDRIARDIVVAATVERLARDAGARVVTSDGVATEDTPEGGLMRGLLDLFASYERAVIRARTRAALQSRRARGLRYTRVAPLGWRFAEGQLVEDAGEREQLTRIREMVGRGLSVAAVVRKLNAEGSQCRGGRWHETSLRRALGRAA